MYEGKAKKTATNADHVAPSTPQRESSAAEPPSAHSAMSNMEDVGDAERAAKDKERWTRLRKVKSYYCKLLRIFSNGTFRTYLVKQVFNVPSILHSFVDTAMQSRARQEPPSSKYHLPNPKI